MNGILTIIIPSIDGTFNLEIPSIDGIYEIILPCVDGVFTVKEVFGDFGIAFNLNSAVESTARRSSVLKIELIFEIFYGIVLTCTVSTKISKISTRFNAIDLRRPVQLRNLGLSKLTQLR